MPRWLVVLGMLFALLAVSRGAAAAEGDAPSGPEACLVDGINQRRGGAAMRWSGILRDSLRSHSAEMAVAGDLSHDGMDGRIAHLPDGWTGYGETASGGALASADDGGVEAWCQEAIEALWNSPSHKQILTNPGFDFISMGVHKAGSHLWITAGLFSHPSYQPPPVTWPASYSQSLVEHWKGRFADDDGSLFEADIETLAAAGITAGCNPPDNTRFCPDAPVTRGEMAVFLTRALGWGTPGGNRFVDDEGSVYERAIEAMAAAGATEGCDPPDYRNFCPDRPVTRGEMATFLGKVLELEPGPGTAFDDISGSVHRAYIDALHAAGITAGCDAGGSHYCPRGWVTRGQMAAFLVRAGLAG
ncbi:MAG TPA: S-layer homology domain-containing protein [Acidimicrobiia bacterium]|nr:S-layer homology domain-containing protein [Acidimicrobiia bacterium]